MKTPAILQSFFWIAGIVTALIAAVGYGQRQASEISKAKIETLEEKLDFYNNLKEYNFPDLFSKMDSSSSSLNEFLRKFDELGLTEYKSSELKDSLLKKEIYIRSIKDELKKSKERISLLKKENLELISENGELAINVGQSKFVLKNSIPIAVTQKYYDRVEFNFDGQKRILRIGEQMEKNIGVGRVIVTLTEIPQYDDKCKVQYLIVKKQKLTVSQIL